MRLDDFLAYLRSQDVRTLVLRQDFGQAYTDRLYRLHRDDNGGLLTSHVTGDDPTDLEDDIVDRVCRQLRIPRP